MPFGMVGKQKVMAILYENRMVVARIGFGARPHYECSSTNTARSVALSTMRPIVRSALRSAAAWMLGVTGASCFAEWYPE
jgi:hypothetical protein